MRGFSGLSWPIRCFDGTPRRGLGAASGIVLTGVLVVGCQANPGPPPLEEETATSTVTSTTTPPEPTSQANTMVFGIDPLTNGFNPHVIADDTSFVQRLADLVLPSPFRDGQLDPDLLVFGDLVEPIPGVAQTARYVIRPEAQWSDGTPITGADFEYLWKSMTTTPGVRGAAGYHTISAIRSLNSGKTVEVDFNIPVAGWRELFTDLLPSHLIADSGQSFGTALRNGIPASAGRLKIDNVDRGRGIVSINRNDRFWGENPATVDTIYFYEIRNISQGLTHMRTGQAVQLDITPQETATDAFELVPDSPVNALSTNRVLSVVANTLSPRLATPELRRQLFGLIDAERLARLAAARSEQLDVVRAPLARAGNPAADQLKAQFAREPLRLATDPTDPVALRAGRALVDLLAAQGVAATLMEADVSAIAGQMLPQLEADAVLTWQVRPSTALQAASAYRCLPAPQAPRGSNLSGFCDPQTDAGLREAVARGARDGAVRDFVNGVEAAHTITLPIMAERRLIVTAEKNRTKAELLNQWQRGSRVSATTPPRAGSAPATANASMPPATPEPAAPPAPEQAIAPDPQEGANQ